MIESRQRTYKEKPDVLKRKIQRQRMQDTSEQTLAEFQVREESIGKGTLIITTQKIIFKGPNNTYHEKKLSALLGVEAKKRGDKIDIIFDSPSDAGPIKYQFKAKKKINIKIETHIKIM